jgi:hypothetical protein
MIKFLKRLWSGDEGVSIEHPMVGTLILRKGKKGLYWMHDAYLPDELTVTFDTETANPPSNEQLAFYGAVINDLDAAFAKTKDLLIPRYEKMMGVAFPKQWRSALRFTGISVPLGGTDTNPWDITFECLTDNTGFLFTCYFENGCPVGVTCDT